MAMLPQELLDIRQAIKTHLLDTCSIVKKGRTKIIVNGIEHNKENFQKLIDVDLLTAVNVSNLQVMKEENKLQIARGLADELLSSVLASRIGTKADAKECFEGEQFDFEGYIPVVDVESGARLLINTSTNELSAVAYEAWEAVTPKDIKDFLLEGARPVKIKYNPYSTKMITKEAFETGFIDTLNLYIPPHWRKRLEPTECPECPRQIKVLLDSLFPIAAQKEAVICWMRHAMLDRNEAYLVLNGAKGVGKGIFCDVMKAIVGKEHYNLTPRGFLQADFNSALLNRRVVVLDEMKVDEKAHDNLKRYANKEQNIQKKGVDADKTVEIYNSYIIANNDTTDMFLECDDRRFSVPDLGCVDFINILSVSEIDALYKELEDKNSELVYQLGYWLFMSRPQPMYDRLHVIKGDVYHQIVRLSLKIWEQNILELLDQEGCCNYADVRRRVKASDKGAYIPRSLRKVEEFLKNFKLEGGVKAFDYDYVNNDGDPDIYIHATEAYTAYSKAQGFIKGPPKEPKMEVFL